MSRTRSFAINSISTALLQVFTLISGLIIPRLILSAYGSSTNGLISSINQFIAYIALVEAGLGGAAIYALYKPLAHKEQQQINIIVSTAKKLYDQAGMFFLSFLILGSLIYPLFIKITEYNYFQIVFLVFFLGCKGLFDILLMGKYRALLTADQKVYIVSISTISFIISNIIIISTLTFFNVNVVITFGFVIISFIIKTVILKLYTNKKYPNLDFKQKSDPHILNQRWDVLYLQVLGAIQRGIPVIALTFFVTLKEISVYSVYTMAILGLSGILSIFATSLFSTFGNLIAGNEQNTLQKAYNEFELGYYLIITIAYICAAFLIIPFIKLYTNGITDVNYNTPILGMLIVINSVFYNLKTPQGMLVMSAGLYKETRWRTTTQALIALLGCFVLGYYFKTLGVMLGIIASNIYRCIDLYIFIPNRVTKLPVLTTIKRITLSIVLISFSIILSLKINFQINTVFSWIYHALILAITASISSTILFYLISPNTFTQSLKRLKNLLLKDTK